MGLDNVSDTWDGPCLAHLETRRLAARSMGGTRSAQRPSPPQTIRPAAAFETICGGQKQAPQKMRAGGALSLPNNLMDEDAVAGLVKVVPTGSPTRSAIQRSS